MPSLQEHAICFLVFSAGSDLSRGVFLTEGILCLELSLSLPSQMADDNIVAFRKGAAAALPELNNS